MSLVGLLLVVLYAISDTAQAADVRVPITLEADYFSRVLIKRAFTGPNQTAVPWNDGTGCNYLQLVDPKVSIVEGTITMVADGEARVGRPISATNCLNFLDWQGILLTEHRPVIDETGKRIRFRVSDSKLLDAEKKERLRSKTVWGWVKKHAHPELERVELDLTNVIEDVRRLIPRFVQLDNPAQMETMLSSLRLNGVRYGKHSVITDLVIKVDAENDLRPTTEPELNPREMADWQERWQAWDSFVTYTVKEAAIASTSTDLRQELLSVMLLARHELDTMLIEPQQPGKDPLRDLFLKSWERLSPLLQRVSHGMPSRSALQLFGFIAAGDALTALDKLGPATGIDISVDGLRRLARLLAQNDTDPILTPATGVDTDLRKLFDFGPPIPLPEEGLSPQGLIDWLIPPVWADFTDDRLLATRLNKIIASPKNARRYVPMVRQLLRQVYTKALNDKPVDPQFQDIVWPMLLATAWQESCFRQNVRREGQIVPLRSRVGAVGLMQVRPSIWRGFYDPEALTKDIGYNARAGTEIMLHYMNDYVIARGEHKREGGMKNVVQATYATYNGGPAHLKRYRQKSTKGSLRAIDKAYWKKYDIVSGGVEAGPLACFGLKP